MKASLKVCCIASLEEAQMAVDHGAWAIGLVSEMPSGPGTIPDNLIAEIARAAPPNLATFLLTCRTEADDIIDHLNYCKTNTVQLVDAVDPPVYKRIRQALPHIRIVQVIHVVDEDSIKEATAASQYVDALLLDSGNPALAVKELGGTGRVHNWDISRSIVQKVHKPILLAGGMKPENVSAAIARVQPFAIDICTGIRTNGCLDRDKLKALTEAME
jgi:phosphoribosylanthranilate isomerase